MQETIKKFKGIVKKKTKQKENRAEELYSHEIVIKGISENWIVLMSF